MKKVILNEMQAKVLVREMLSRAVFSLNEISSVDAYQKFYANKIPADLYNKVMAGTPVMTPLHKLALDKILIYFNCKDGSEGEPEAEFLAALVSQFWTTASEEAKQYVMELLPKTPAEKKDLSTFQFKSILYHASNSEHHTEARSEEHTSELQSRE